MSALVFDVDGTLWDSARPVAESWSLITTERLGFPVTESMMRSAMGLTMDEIAERLFPILEKKERSLVLKECEVQENAYLLDHPGTLYPEVEKTLAELKKRHSLFIVSNSQKGYVEAFLASTRLDAYFSAHLCYGDNLLPKDGNISLILKSNGFLRGYYIGDTHKDELATEKTGSKFIHASYGFGTSERPYKSISKFADLLTLDREGFLE